MGTRTAIIVGSGGHAKTIASYLGPRPIRLMVERDPGPDDLLQSDVFAGAVDEAAEYFIGIGDNLIRRRYFDRLKAMGLTIGSCIAPTAWIAETATLGEGVFVGAFSTVGADARLGDSVVINTKVNVDHDTEVADDCQIAAGVTIGGGARFEKSCFVGLQACILPKLTIGEGAIVAAASLVTRDVPPYVLVMGSPARIIRELDPA